MTQTNSGSLFRSSWEDSAYCIVKQPAQYTYMPESGSISNTRHACEVQDIVLPHPQRHILNPSQPILPGPSVGTA